MPPIGIGAQYYDKEVKTSVETLFALCLTRQDGVCRVEAQA
jgi:hypothetical protein